MKRIVRARKTSRSRVALGCLGLALFALTLPGPQAGADTPAPWPGLPDGYGVQWSGAAQAGISEVARARQWIRVPVVVSSVDVDVAAERLPDGTNTLNTNRAYFVSPAGAEDNYGHLAPIRVRTVAFGAIPVALTVHISQQRDQNDLPEPIVLSTADRVFTVPQPTTYTLSASEVTANLDVRISDVSVDGVPVDVGPDCVTEGTAALVMRGNGYERLTVFEKRDLLESVEGKQTTYAAGQGGNLEGTIQIPAFAGCTQGEEDISPLLTGTASGPGNALSVQLTGPSCPGPVSLKGPEPGSGDKIERCSRRSLESQAAWGAIEAQDLPKRP